MVYPQEKALIGLDLGTSAIKGVVVTTTGTTLGEAKAEMTLDYKARGRVEFDPDSFFDRLCAVLESLKQKAPETEISAISMAAAAGNTLLLDANFTPLAPAVSWMDSRVKYSEEPILPELDKGDVHQVVGWPWNDLFPLAHLGWIKKQTPDLLKRATHVGMNLNYVLYRLSGLYAVDTSTATQLYLRNQVNQCWHEPYLRALSLTPSQLPSVQPPGKPLARLDSAVAEQTGLREQPWVVLGAFDHPCAARGTNTLTPSTLMLSCGTSWVGFYPMNDRRLAVSENMLVDPFMVPDAEWAGLFSLPCLGVGVDWCIDNLIAPEQATSSVKYAVFNRYAAQAATGADGLRLNIMDTPFSKEQTDELTGRWSPSQISRAVMESAAFQMRRKIEKFSSAGIKADQVTMVGGPSESPVWPQILADVTGVNLNLAHGANAGALGAAILAGVGAGFFANEREAAHRFAKQSKQVVQPNSRNREMYEKISEVPENDT